MNSNDKVFYINFGCRLNQYETDSIYAEFQSKNIPRTEILEEATYVIINTCTVTNRSDSKNRNTIRSIYKKNPKAKIILTGCYATTNQKDLLLPGVKKIIPNIDKAFLPKIVLNEKTKPSAKSQFAYNYHLKNRSRGYLKIQDGCNRTCSYCKIPIARGKATSRSIQDCIKEANNLIQLGYQELTLTGVNIGDYSDGSLVFTDLLKELINLHGKYYLRISSLEPPDLTNKIVKIFTHEKIASFLHIPIQSASKKILKQMNRKYNLDKVLERILLLREIYPQIHIGTDVIIGFPNETEEDFQDTVDFCKKAKFANIHIFPFSKRTGTSIVDKLENKSSNKINSVKEVNGSIIKKRIQILTTLKNKLEEEYKHNIHNFMLKGIIEKVDNEKISGITENYVSFEINKKDFIKKNIFSNEIENNISLKGRGIQLKYNSNGNSQIIEKL